MTPSPLSRVIFYDTANLFKAGYYVEGLYRRSREGALRFSVSRTPPRHLIPALTDAEWQYTLFACALFEARLGSRSVFFCIDTHDINRIETIDGRRQGFHLPLLEQVDLYFKVNFNARQIAASNQLRLHADKILPINQFIPIRPTPMLPFVLWPRFVMGGYDLGARHTKLLHRWRQRWRNLRHWVTYDRLLARRQAEKDLDVFFVTSFRGRPRHDDDMQDRLRLVEGIRRIPNLQQLTGLASDRKLPAPFAAFGTPRFKQADYLDRLARSKIVVYTRGMDDCLASKFALFQALGACIVGNTVVNNPGLVENHAHLKEQFAFDDTAGILHRVEQLVGDPVETARLGHANQAGFDRHFSPEATADDIVSAIQLQFG